MTMRDEVREEELAGLSDSVGRNGFEHNDTARRPKDNFRFVFETSIDPSFLLEGDVFVDSNEAALALLRCPAKKQLIGLRPLDVSPGKQPDGHLSSESMRKMIDTALSVGGVRFDWKHIRFDGQEMLVDVSLTAISLDGESMIYAVLRDMPADKREENKAGTDTHLFLAIVEKMPLVMAVVDENGNYVYTNPRFNELFGRGVDALPTSYAPSARSASVGQGYVSSKEEPAEWAFIITDKANSKHVFKATPVKLPSCCLHVYQDITLKE